MTSTTDELATNSEIDGQLLRVDRRGRVRVSAERREAILTDFDRSGLSGAAYARLHGIRYSTFASWVQKRRRGSGGGVQPSERANTVRLAEVVVEPGEAAALTIELPGGVRMRVSSREQASMAAGLLKELGGPGRC